MVPPGTRRAPQRRVRRRRGGARPLPGLGRTGPAGPGLRPRRRRPRALVGPRGRPLRPPLPRAGDRPVGPRRQRPPARVLAHPVDRRGHGRGVRRWHRRPAGRRRPQHGRFRHDRHRRPPLRRAGGRHRVRLAGGRPRPRGQRGQRRHGVRRPPHLPHRRRLRSNASARSRPRSTTSTTSSTTWPATRCARSRAGGSGSSTAACSPSSPAQGIRGQRPALPARGALPVRPAALRVRPGHRGHRRRHVRRPGPGHARSSRSPRPATTPCSTSR